MSHTDDFATLDTGARRLGNFGTGFLGGLRQSWEGTG